jgi:hypothetical protein
MHLLAQEYIMHVCGHFLDYSQCIKQLLTLQVFEVLKFVFNNFVFCEVIWTMSIENPIPVDFIHLKYVYMPQNNSLYEKKQYNRQ